jgi:hypothetical protein
MRRAEDAGTCAPPGSFTRRRTVKTYGLETVSLRGGVTTFLDRGYAASLKTVTMPINLRCWWLKSSADVLA